MTHLRGRKRTASNHLFTCVAVAVLTLVACSGGPDRVLSNAPIVCFGDSLTAGTGAPREESYPSQLARRIGREVINAGVPGDTTEMAMRRLERDVLAHSPSAVLITLGGNDYMRSVPKDVAFNNLEEIVNRIQNQGALVIVGGFDVPFFGKGYDQEYKRVAHATGCELIPNVYKGIFGKSKLMSDRIHPNEDGYAIMMEHFHDALRPYLE
ncbi:MAG: arylesterase [bacterium]|nr:arylesterase [bacterium]